MTKRQATGESGLIWARRSSRQALGRQSRSSRAASRRIGQIGHDCGFNDPDNLKRLFRKRFGMSMREHRNSLG